MQNQNNDEFVAVQDEPIQELYPPLPSNETIFAANISPKATETSLREFFGICGPIKKISLNTINDGEKETQTAIIVFENDEAAKTAIFLNDTFIIDSAITVVPYKGEQHFQNNNNNQPNSSAVEPNQNQGKPSFFVNVLAATYMFGAKAWQKAVDFDKQHKITETIHEKAKKVDTSLGISEKTKVVGDKISQGIGSIDKSLKISEKTNHLATKTNDKYQALKQRNEKTQKFFENMDSLGKKISTKFEDAVKVAQQKVDLVRAEIKRREEEENKNKVTETEVLSNEENNNNIPAKETTSLLSDTDSPVNENNNNNNNNNSNYNNDENPSIISNDKNYNSN